MDLRPCLAAAQAVDRAVAGDAGEPGQGLALRRIEAARRPPDVDVHLLQDVFGLGSVPVDTQHHREQMRAGALVKRGKCRTVAEAARAEQARQIEAALGPVGGGFDHERVRHPACGRPSYNSALKTNQNRCAAEATRTPSPGSADDVEIEFYEALQRGDIERLMALWSDDDEICCVHPGGARLVGAPRSAPSFEAMFGNGTIDARPDKVRRLDTHSTAVHSVLERIRVLTPDGERFAWVVATNVYLKSAQGWRLVAHHASPGAPSEVQDSAETVSTLH